jgi:hypothetical protein
MGATYEEAYSILKRANVIRATKCVSLEEKRANRTAVSKKLRVAWGISGAIAAATGEPVPKKLMDLLQKSTIEHKPFFLCDTVSLYLYFMLAKYTSPLQFINLFFSSSYSPLLQNVLVVLKNLNKMYTNGVFPDYFPDAAKELDLAAVIRNLATATTSGLDTLLKISQHSYDMLRYDGGFEHVLSQCVREVARRCTFSRNGAFRYTSRSRAVEVSALAGILALLCKNFRDDMDRVGNEERDFMARGAEKSLLDSWFHYAWFDGTLFSRHQGDVPAREQLHFTEVPELIITIAKFLGSNGSPYLQYLNQKNLKELAANLHRALFEVQKVGGCCTWLLGDAAAALNELVKHVIKAGLGREASDGSLMAELAELASSSF